VYCRMKSPRNGGGGSGDLPLCEIQKKKGQMYGVFKRGLNAVFKAQKKM